MKIMRTKIKADVNSPNCLKVKGKQAWVALKKGGVWIQNPEHFREPKDEDDESILDNSIQYFQGYWVERGGFPQGEIASSQM